MEGAAGSLQVARPANPPKCGGICGEQIKSFNIKGLVAEAVGATPEKKVVYKQLGSTVVVLILCRRLWGRLCGSPLAEA